MWIDYPANAVYIQHAGLELKPLHCGHCGYWELANFNLWRHDREANITFLWVKRTADDEGQTKDEMQDEVMKQDTKGNYRAKNNSRNNSSNYI